MGNLGWDGSEVGIFRRERRRSLYQRGRSHRGDFIPSKILSVFSPLERHDRVRIHGNGACRAIFHLEFFKILEKCRELRTL